MTRFHGSRFCTICAGEHKIESLSGLRKAEVSAPSLRARWQHSVSTLVGTTIPKTTRAHSQTLLVPTSPPSPLHLQCSRAEILQPQNPDMVIRYQAKPHIFDAAAIDVDAAPEHEVNWRVHRGAYSNTSACVRAHHAQANARTQCGVLHTLLDASDPIAQQMTSSCLRFTYYDNKKQV